MTLQITAVSLAVSWGKSEPIIPIYTTPCGSGHGATERLYPTSLLEAAQSLAGFEE